MIDSLIYIYMHVIYISYEYSEQNLHFIVTINCKGEKCDKKIAFNSEINEKIDLYPMMTSN